MKKLLLLLLSCYLFSFTIDPIDGSTLGTIYFSGKPTEYSRDNGGSIDIRPYGNTIAVNLNSGESVRVKIKLDDNSGEFPTVYGDSTKYALGWDLVWPVDVSNATENITILSKRNNFLVGGQYTNVADLQNNLAGNHTIYLNFDWEILFPADADKKYFNPGDLVVEIDIN